MNIEFTGTYAQNENGGINFQVKIDGQTIPCVVSIEALQDINPPGRMNGVVQQYMDNKDRFEAIAQEKIQNNQVTNGKVFINSSDVS